MNRRGVWAARLAAAASLAPPDLGLRHHAPGVLTAHGPRFLDEAASRRCHGDRHLAQRSRESRLVVTDATGQFRIPNLPPGTYTLRLDKDAHRPYSRGGIELRVDSTIRVNSRAAPRGAARPRRSWSSAAAPTVDIGSSATGVNVGTDFASRIPLIPTEREGRRHPLLRGPRRGGAGRRRRPLRRLDQRHDLAGEPVRDRRPVGEQPGLRRHRDAARPSSSSRRPNMITGGYLPEYGRATGGYLDAVTKSGANEFHGVGRSSASPPASSRGRTTGVHSEASAITTDTRLSSLRNVGVEIGGPILRDRLWFYTGPSPSPASLPPRARPELRSGTRPDRRHSRRSPGPNGVTTPCRASHLHRQADVADRRDNTITLSVYGSPTTSGATATSGSTRRDGTLELEQHLQQQHLINGAYGALAHRYINKRDRRLAQVVQGVPQQDVPARRHARRPPRGERDPRRFRRHEDREREGALRHPAGPLAGAIPGSTPSTISSRPRRRATATPRARRPPSGARSPRTTRGPRRPQRGTARPLPGQGRVHGPVHRPSATTSSRPASTSS